MKIKVTQEHITKGQCWEPKCCPIALALIDVGFKKVRVCIGRIEINRKFYSLPQEARKFMTSFDTNLNVQPFEFEFNARLSLYNRLKTALNESISSLRRAK